MEAQAGATRNACQTCGTVRRCNDLEEALAQARRIIEGDSVWLSFDYDEAMKDELKGLNIGAGWKPERKIWQVPLTRWTAEKLAGYLKRHGFTFNEETLRALRQAAYGEARV